MYDFNIIKNNKLKNKSFRVAKIYDQFDLNGNNYKEEFIGKIEVPKEWNIGVIVGKSGTGKTSIVNKLFKSKICEFNYTHSSVIDDFEKEIDSQIIFNMLSRVGFSSPPSWLKPYRVLSNGEKMRVDLARALCQNKDIIIFDEFTSVVDREVAQIGSFAVSKAIRKTDKKFIAVSCHFDILKWLQPDWIFSTDEMKNLPRGSLQQRPEIRIEVRRIKGYWNMFKRYHYLNHDLNKAAHQYVGFYNSKPIVFCATINMPHPKYSRTRKIHRVVVLPDYQGLGIGSRMIDLIAETYIDYVGIVTSLNEFAKSLINNKKWVLIRIGKTIPNSNISGLNKTLSSNRNTYSFRYIPEGKRALNA
jgi:GNAT superfamily N-acetyltransferase